MADGWRLLGDDVDLIDALSTLQTSGELAKYSLKTKRTTVRGKKLDGATKVTLAHELTHALQDQHFNLTKLQRAADRTHSSDALRALDAAGLSPATAGIREPTLDDVFLSLTGRRAEAEPGEQDPPERDAPRPRRRSRTKEVV